MSLQNVDLNYDTGYQIKPSMLHLYEACNQAFVKILLLLPISPILGGVLADQFLGKFKSILWICLVYVSGLILLTLTAMPVLNFPQM